MGESTVNLGWGLAGVLVLLVVIAVVVARISGLGTANASLIAAVRATVQLAAVSLVIVAVIRQLWSAAVFVLIMLLIAALTSARRMTPGRSGLLAIVPITIGTAPVLALVLGTGTVPVTGIALVPVAGILIGGAMTATSQTGVRAFDELRARRGEFEAGLALGFVDRDAALEVIRPSAAQTMIPALDTTRTVGLVTLPGAFVGVLIGSGDPVQAGAAQLLVLIGLLAGNTIAVAITVELVARSAITRP